MKLNEVLPEQYQKFNEQNIESLKEIMTGDSKVTWMLGAGMSVPAKLPMWSKLLAKMWAVLLNIDLVNPENEKKPIIDSYRKAKNEILSRFDAIAEGDSDSYREKYQEKMKNAMAGTSDSVFDGGNTLEMAEYILNYIIDIVSCHNYLDKTEDVANSILKSVIKRALEVDVDLLEEHLKDSSLDEVAKILIHRQGTKAITYNYDTLLEWCLIKYLDACGGSQEHEQGKNNEPKRELVVLHCNKYKVPYKENDIIVSHPHGILNVAGIESLEDSRDVILTESSYYKMESSIYNWINSIQAAALHESSCIFAGFSGEDYNFRRIVKNLEDGKDIKLNMHQHFIFYCVDELVKKTFSVIDSESTETDKVKALKSLENSYEYVQFITKLYAQYNYWESRGITTIWTTYEEMSGVIKMLQMEME